MVHALILLSEHQAPTESISGLLHEGIVDVKSEKLYTGSVASSISRAPKDAVVAAVPAGQAVHVVKEGSGLK